MMLEEQISIIDYSVRIGVPTKQIVNVHRSPTINFDSVLTLIRVRRKARHWRARTSLPGIAQNCQKLSILIRESGRIGLRNLLPLGLLDEYRLARALRRGCGL